MTIKTNGEPMGNWLVRQDIVGEPQKRQRRSNCGKWQSCDW